MITQRFIIITMTVVMATVCAQAVSAQQLAQEPAVSALGPAQLGARQTAYRAPEGGVAVCGDPGAACCDPAEQCEPSCSAGCACDPPACLWCQGGTIAGDPWELPDPRLLQSLGATWGGWVSAGIYANTYGARSNGPLAMNDVGDGFTFNQWWTYAERVANTEERPIDWGLRVDFVFGVDAPDTQAFGGHPDSWDNPWDTARDYGFALPQLYGEVAFHSLRVKFGHFFTLIGYEVVPATGNFFYSHAYTHFYGEPFTHTGVLAEHPFGEHITLYGGWVQGWDTGFDNTPGTDMFLGGFGVALTERMDIIYATTFGNLGANVAAGDFYMHSLIWEWRLTERFTYVLQNDLGNNRGNAAGDSQWYGVNQYFQYELNDCWAAGMRVEWFHDDDGARIPSNYGRRGDYWELTWGLNWRPHANLVLRPEIRYDWFDGWYAAGDLPFNSGAASHQFSGGFDLILTY